MTVLYFDDPMFDRLTDQTRLCNEFRTCCCGGSGERVRIDAPFCFDLCLRGTTPCCCIPVCCPNALCPCILRHEIYVEDAQRGLYEIKRARHTALNPVILGTGPKESMERPSSGSY